MLAKKDCSVQATSLQDQRERECMAHTAYCHRRGPFAHKQPSRMYVRQRGASTCAHWYTRTQSM